MTATAFECSCACCQGCHCRCSRTLCKRVSASSVRRRPRRCSNKTSMSRMRRKKPKNSFEFIYGGSMPIYHGAYVCAFPAIRASKLVIASLIIPPTSRKTSTHVYVDTGRKIRPSNTTQDSMRGVHLAWAMPPMSQGIEAGRPDGNQDNRLRKDGNNWAGRVPYCEQ